MDVGPRVFRTCQGPSHCIKMPIPGGFTSAQVSVENETGSHFYCLPNTSSANVSHCLVEAPHTQCPSISLAPMPCPAPPGDSLSDEASSSWKWG